MGIHKSRLDERRRWLDGRVAPRNRPADSFAVKAWGRYLAVMQGRLIIGALALSLLGAPALAGEISKRVACPKAEQTQQRQQQLKDQAQQPRTRSQGCVVQRQIPPVVDPTPHYFL